MSRRRLTPREIQLLEETLNADYKDISIRLREGEYQHVLAKIIVALQLELHFPNVKDITARLYGAEKANDVQSIRKVQTILKKMEKSGVVRILPKKKPWELQRYMLSSFKFQDIDKNLVTLAVDEQTRDLRNLLDSMASQKKALVARIRIGKIKIGIFAIATFASYVAILWNFLQSTVDPIIFAVAFSMAVVCSLTLGRMLS
jgi:hypothetical protein